MTRIAIFNMNISWKGDDANIANFEKALKAKKQDEVNDVLHGFYSDDIKINFKEHKMIIKEETGEGYSSNSTNYFLPLFKAFSDINFIVDIRFSAEGAGCEGQGRYYCVFENGKKVYDKSFWLEFAAYMNLWADQFELGPSYNDENDFYGIDGDDAVNVIAKCRLVELGKSLTEISEEDIEEYLENNFTEYSFNEFPGAYLINDKGFQDYINIMTIDLEESEESSYGYEYYLELKEEDALPALLADSTWLFLKEQSGTKDDDDEDEESDNDEDEDEDMSDWEEDEEEEDEDEEDENNEEVKQNFYGTWVKPDGTIVSFSNGAYVFKSTEEHYKTTVDQWVVSDNDDDNKSEYPTKVVLFCEVKQVFRGDTEVDDSFYEQYYINAEGPVICDEDGNILKKSESKPTTTEKKPVAPVEKPPAAKPAPAAKEPPSPPPVKPAPVKKEAPAPVQEATGAVCPKCGKVARVGAKFCSSCGTKFDPVCANCGRQLKATSKFCPGCGTKVE